MRLFTQRAGQGRNGQVVKIWWVVSTPCSDPNVPLFDLERCTENGTCHFGILLSFNICGVPPFFGGIVRDGRLDHNDLLSEARHQLPRVVRW